MLKFKLSKTHTLSNILFRKGYEQSIILFNFFFEGGKFSVSYRFKYVPQVRCLAFNIDIIAITKHQRNLLINVQYLTNPIYLFKYLSISLSTTRYTFEFNLKCYKLTFNNSNNNNNNQYDG